MTRKPVRRPSDGRIRVYGLGWTTPKLVAVLIAVVILLFIIDFYVL